LQRRVDNGAWFDLNGRMIGWGDLSDEDLAKIAKTIPFGELFIVVDTQAQPVGFTVDKFVWLVERGSVYSVLRYSLYPDDETSERMMGVRFRRIIRPTAVKIIARIKRLNIE
jgi:hypothetical protein